MGYGAATSWDFIDLVYCVERLDLVILPIALKRKCRNFCHCVVHNTETKMSRWQNFSSLGAPKVVILTTWRKFCQHDIFVSMNDVVNRRWHRHNWFRRWFVACSVPGHFQIQRWIIFRWYNVRNKLPWNVCIDMKWNKIIFKITGETFENVMPSAIRDDVCSGLDISTDVIQIRLLYSIACTTIWTSVMEMPFYMWHDDVIKWKHFPRYWPFVRGIHRSPVNSPHKGQWHGALMFSLICIWINDWVNNREAGDLRRYRAHYDAIVMNDSPIDCHRFWRIKNKGLIKCIPGTKFRHYIIQAQRMHRAIITSFLRQNDVATSFWRKIDVIVASYVRWEDFNGKFEKTEIPKTYHICMNLGKKGRLENRYDIKHPSTDFW